ncbi:hypothetical protein BCAR13_1330007 [Paraburkholderia caribensis]|nr:hypothetical protein BCAR13_1330007 [Paraburkholderia caribensis]
MLLLVCLLDRSVKISQQSASAKAAFAFSGKTRIQLLSQIEITLIHAIALLDRGADGTL